MTGSGFQPPSDTPRPFKSRVPPPPPGGVGAKLHSGSTMTRKSVKLTNIGVIFHVKLTDFRVIVDSEWSLVAMDPFPGHADPGVLRVNCSTALVVSRTVVAP